MEWELVIGVASMVIALCALAASAYGLWMTYRHDRVAVEPHLRFRQNSAVSEHGPCRLEVQLISAGIGPAVVKHFRVLVDGDDVAENWDLLRLLYKLDILTLPGSERTHYYVVASGERVAVGETFTVFSFEIAYTDDASEEGPKPTPDQRWRDAERLERGLRRLAFEVEYASAYRQPMPPETWHGAELVDALSKTTNLVRRAATSG